MTDDEDWRQDAACAETGDVGFFAPYWDEDAHRGDQIVHGWTALAVCRGCAVRDECLSFALERPELEGIWGGTRHKQRLALLRIRRAS